MTELLALGEMNRQTLHVAGGRRRGLLAEVELLEELAQRRVSAQVLSDLRRQRPPDAPLVRFLVRIGSGRSRCAITPIEGVLDEIAVPSSVEKIVPQGIEQGPYGGVCTRGCNVQEPHQERVSWQSAFGLRLRGLHAGRGELVEGPAQESELLGVAGATDEA